MRASEIDKCDAFLHKRGKLFAELCRICALSYLIRAARTDYREFFKPLMKNRIHDAHQWAKASNVTERYIRDICKLHTGISPSYAIPYYYVLERLLRGYPCEDDCAFEDDCARIVYDNFDKEYAPLYMR
jgi:hypothetical protein